jgi:hypothetical protein
MLPIFLGAVFAQQSTPIPPETKEFAFWVGSWTCEGTLFGPPDTKTTGSNRITVDFGGHVVHEHFAMQGLRGESWSVYIAAAKKWRQTWVDDSGSYIALEGGLSDGKMILTTLPNASKPNFKSRMTFYNISKQSFDWDWEGSQDAGTTWKLNWRLHYTRDK